ARRPRPDHERRPLDPPAGVRRLPDPAGRDRGRRHQRARGRLPADRHRAGLPERGGRRRRAGRLRGRPRRRVHHHQADQQRAGLRQDHGGVRRQHDQARHRRARPVPDPLAAADVRPVRRHLARLREAAGRRPDPLHRGVELRDRALRAAGRRDQRGPGRQPDRAAPAVPAGRAARLPRGARHPHRVLGPDRPGQGPAGERAHSRGRGEGRPHPGPGGAALAHPARAGRHPQVGDPEPDPGKHPAVRLHPRRRRHGRHRQGGDRRAARTGPEDLRPPL
ncbi:MAG: oxidoreductase of aldo/keto reductase family, subgroup 1, partial [uncultured Friedmanniella sp.]